jgi:hypothetical protein
MQVAQWTSRKSATVAHLPVSALYLLSSPSTPKDFVADVLKRVEGGERVAVPALREELRSRRDLKPDARTERLPVTPRQHDELPAIDQQSKAVDPAIRDAVLGHAVAIIARGLSEADFKRVHDIMTSRSVLDDPHLARNIATAFLAIEGSNVPPDVGYEHGVR